MTLGDREVTNRDLLCRKCVYKKRGDTASCLRYEQKPESVFSGSCEFFLKDGAELTKGGCSDCSGGCSDCGSCRS